MLFSVLLTSQIFARCKDFSSPPALLGGEKLMLARPANEQTLATADNHLGRGDASVLE